MESHLDHSNGLRVVVACYIKAYFLFIISSHFQLGVQSHHPFLVTMFRVVFLNLTIIVISLVWRSKPLFPLGIHSYCFSLAFRATISSQFGVQSHGFSLAFRAAFSIWRSEPHFQFGVQSHIFNLAFRAAFSIWRSEPHFHFGVQSHIFCLAFRAAFFSI